MSWRSKTASAWPFLAGLFACSETTPALLRTSTVAWCALVFAKAAQTSSVGAPSPSHLKWSASSWQSLPLSRSRIAVALRLIRNASSRLSRALAVLQAWPKTQRRHRPSSVCHRLLSMGEPLLADFPAPPTLRPHRPPAMAPRTPEQSLQFLRKLYRQAYRCDPACNEAVIGWAESPELWATHQVRFKEWSYLATEAVVRQCRIHRKRARQAMESNA